MHENYENQINDLMSGNTSNSNIQEYSTEDEILSILEGEEQRGIFCGDKKARRNKNNRNYQSPIFNDLFLQGKLSYEPYGVYFILKVDFENRQRILGLYSIVMSLPTNSGYAFNAELWGRCNNPFSYTIRSSTCGSVPLVPCLYPQTKAVQYIYEGGRALKGYRVLATFQNTYMQVPISNPPLDLVDLP